MTNNGFYAAMKTGDGVRAVFIDEATFRREAERERREQQAREVRRVEQGMNKAMRRFQRAVLHLLGQELKLIGMGLVLWLGHRAGLVDMAFAAPVLIAFQTVICFRAGKFWGKWGRKFHRAGK